MATTARIKRTQHRKLDPRVLKGGRVRVGFPESKSTRSNIEKAVWNEFGTRRGVPERPFMRNALRNNATIYKKALRASASKILLGDVTLKSVLNKLGALVQGDIQDEITAMREPPNAPQTVKRKRSSKPLIDTGAMRQAVTWVVE